MPLSNRNQISEIFLQHKGVSPKGEALFSFRAWRSESFSEKKGKDCLRKVEFETINPALSGWCLFGTAFFARVAELVDAQD
ncbi:MAG: hypothetical protein CMO55_23085 [Verrucomicrobiales bacterium]|nr:hypothetical protein [Verrucomicrobiales bacterium]